MASPAPRRMTVAEFLDWDDGSDRRYQLIEGVPVMMAPALEAHGELVVALGAEIRARLERPCRVIEGAGIGVPHRRDTFYVADLAVTCAPREPGRRMIADPILVVEILSPSTGQIDRFRKVADYRMIESVQEILIVFGDDRRVELQRRGRDGWIITDLIGQAEVVLGCCAGAIPLESIYGDPLAPPRD